MDIFVHNVAEHVNNVEFRVFLKDELQAFGILAFDVVKKRGFSWAVVTVAKRENGQRFLKRFGRNGGEILMFHGRPLSCKVSNKVGQPEPMKVISLLQKEQAISSTTRATPQSLGLTPSRSQPIYSITSLSTGVWNYDRFGKLVFDGKVQDRRVGSIIFGKAALVIYLGASAHHGYDWHGRIDIPYAILEHTIPSVDNGKQGSITLTLKSPPKIYAVMNTEDLRLYTGNQTAAIDPILSALANLNLGSSRPNQKSPNLERMCRLDHRYDRSSALCMVYKLVFPNQQLVRHAWTFVKQFSVPQLYCWQSMVPHHSTHTIEQELHELEKLLITKELEFAVQFQILALVLEGTITPAKMKELISYIRSISLVYGSSVTALAVKSLGQQIPTPAPHVDSTELATATLHKLLKENVLGVQKSESTHNSLRGKRKQHEHLALTYKATITPTGMVLRGPDWSVSNRILRNYPGHHDYFMRVFFADEDGMSVFYDPKASQEQVYARFRRILQEGISVAGRHFEFLGFSHASLRYHQVWFMAPFMHGDTWICAKDVIRELGDFTHIHCSAKCAARIGQAFSDTIFAIPIPKTAYVSENKADVKRNGRVFSDGCGTMSLELFKRYWRTLPPYHRQKRPTVIQIRYRGAKGVLSLDSVLRDEQLHIRDSMTKYVAKDRWKDLEICGAAYKPLRLYLNHQFIKILEDLGVPLRNFIEVQNEARRTLEMVIKHPLNAASFLEYSHSGVHAKMPRLFQLMNQIGLSFHADRFLSEIVEVAAMSSLRSLKYRARIPIEHGYLLYGIMDETNTLKEGQVYIATEDETDSGRRERHILLRDRIVVTRAPALHPGDVQIVAGVDVPQNSSLRDLHNCIVFSQQGPRDLPSKLSGGDLDGDLFHIIYDKRLIPNYIHEPADYAAAVPKDLGRPVEANDIAEFFIEFMINDKLGQISNIHKIRADRKHDGTLDSDCILLAKLASDAVDFSKSGVPADLRQLPRGEDKIRPDFMAPGHNFVIDELGATALENLELDDIDDPDSLSALDPDKSQIRYYRSDKVLGHLYRNIDEQQFFQRMKGEFAAMQHARPGDSLVEKLERYIDRETRFVQWDHHTTFAENLREYYESNMIEIMDTLRVHRGNPLTELEVFSGNILGKKERASTRYIREANQEVQERFNRDVSEIINNIIKGDGDFDGDDDLEALPRAIACFKVALETEGWGNKVTLKSWKYVAAAVCLEQLWRYQGGTLRPL